MIVNRSSRSLALFVAFAFALLGFAGPARAHFVWIVVDDASATARLTFGEGPYGLTSPRLFSYVDPIRPRLADGSTVEIKPGEHGPVGVVRAGEAVGSTHSPGLFGPQGKQFLLTYHAKGAGSWAAAATRVGLRAELVAERNGDEVIVTAFWDGKPKAGIEIVVQAPDSLEHDTLETDRRGTVRFAAPREGLLGVRGVVEEPKRGVHEGTAYTLVKHWTTLTIAVVPEGAAIPTGADAVAWSLLQQAELARYAFPESFHAVSSKLVFRDGGSTHEGTFRYEHGRGITALDVPGLGEEGRRWLEQSLASLILHRIGGSYALGEGRHRVTFGAEAPDVRGHVVQLNDRSRTQYRVRDGRIYAIERVLGATRLGIHVLESTETRSGQSIGRRFMVTRSDAKTGALRSSEAITDEYTEVGEVLFPVVRRTIATGDREWVREIVLKDPVLEPRQTP